MAPRRGRPEARKAGSLVGLRPRPHRAGGAASGVPLRGRTSVLNESPESVPGAPSSDRRAATGRPGRLTRA